MTNEFDERTTSDNQADIERLNRGMAIRRSKKRVNIINEARIKLCINRFDNKSFSRLQFLRAVSHSRPMGPHSSRMFDEATESDDENSDDDTASVTSNDDAVATAAQDTAAVNDDCCEVCLVAARDARITLVPCGHQRFCESCANEVFCQGRGCPICRAGINMILRLY